MKYKHKLEGLQAVQSAWDKSGAANQHATTRPGSEKKGGTSHSRPTIKHHKGHPGRLKKKK